MRLKSLLTLFRNVQIKSIKKGETVIQQGAIQKDLFLIRNGLIRSYQTNEKGEEITFQLFPEYHVFGNVHSILFNEPSKFYFEALEPSKLYAMDYDSFFQMASKNPQIFEINSQYLAKLVIRQAFQRVESFVFLSPEERYLKYMKSYPGVINRAADKHIAHVLGITPVSLSRIKGRITSKK